ncbi:MAG: dTDP-4-dehydrorhamnose 3,5-epimerase family protein [Thermoguttaceae bacterium]|jgi:dTDP-4-dehydrorhamnose 3,5-epimerase
MIDGVGLTALKRIPIPNGDVYHAMKRSDPGYNGFGEAYFSAVKPGAVKAWKRHRQMTLNLVVPVGAIKFVIYDDRWESSTAGQTWSVVLSPQNYMRLTIPPGLWFGFQGVAAETSLLLNLADIEHSPDENEQQPPSSFGYRWDEITA